MDFEAKVGETVTIIHPDTGERIDVRLLVTTENRIGVRVDAPRGIDVTHIRKPRRGPEGSDTRN